MLNSKNSQVLIADDDNEFRRSLKKLLVKAGYQVSQASNGIQASEMVAKRTYPLILLDIHMPGKSGLSVLNELKTISPKSKVIIITVNDDAKTYSDAMNSGAFAFLNKPVKMKEILNYATIALEKSTN